jgi:hypothetical protein
MSDDRRVLTARQMAARDGVSKMTVLRRLAAGQLRGRKIDGRWLIDPVPVAASAQGRRP